MMKRLLGSSLNDRERRNVPQRQPAVIDSAAVRKR
jgi:hypothetical protein